jgi:EXPERA (EXPanded EBP superfamily)
MSPGSPFTLESGTLLSLGFAFSLMPAAQLLASISLPNNVSTKYKYLFLWHTYDFLTHFFVEGSYLYHCFFSYIDIPPATSDYPHPASLNSHDVYFLGQKSRRYGAIYSTAPMARLWQEYAKADLRWGGADLTVISLEILTVGLAGPCATYIAYLISQITSAPAGKGKTKLQARMWFLATMLATGELYGGEAAKSWFREDKPDIYPGFMTFCPEWLSGNPQLTVDDPVYLWLYLVFFNILWVFIPAWVLWEAWREIALAFESAEQTTRWKKGR